MLYSGGGMPAHHSMVNIENLALGEKKTNQTQAKEQHHSALCCQLTYTVILFDVILLTFPSNRVSFQTETLAPLQTYETQY